jgi:hypothetical protein
MTDPPTSEIERRQERIAANQSIFREINENLERLNEQFREVIPVGDFVCECADTNCTARIGLTVEEYERVRSDPTHFAVRHGHVFPEAERVVEEHVGYTVVEKLGAAATYATKISPRS